MPSEAALKALELHRHKGYFKPGQAPKGWGPYGRKATEMIKLAQEYGPEAIAALVWVMQNYAEHKSAVAIVRAAELLLNRGYGQPKGDSGGGLPERTPIEAQFEALPTETLEAIVKATNP